MRRRLNFCWTEGPESVAIVIPSLEPAAAEEGQVAYREWSRDAASNTTAAASETRHLHRTKNMTSSNYDYCYDERRTAVHI